MTEEKKNPLLSGIMAGYLVILAHILLVIILATAVIFIQTLSEYIEYVLAGGLLIIFGSALFFYRILKQNGKQIIDTLKNPAFQGQNIEISLLGGLASVSINSPEKSHHLMLDQQTPIIQALPERPTLSPHNELIRLGDLHDRGLISKEEFLKLKDEVLIN
ncbi:MAG: SHOCT domain-containing protein [Deltaproteobacteria bacterium]|nr:SHOCT domain-containing protein [Candidatus Tharpella aukensis]